MFPRCYSFDALRNLLEFKHVRLKSSNDSLKRKTKEKLCRNATKNHSEILSEILNCNVHTADEIITKNRNSEFNQYNFYQNAKFCKNYLKLSDLIEFPSLLTMQPSLLQHRYFSLKELGFYNIAPSYIFRFSYILSKTPQEVKESGFPFMCEYKSHILHEYLSISERTEIKNRLQNMYTDGSSFQKIKQEMNAEFLSAKLGCSIGTAHKMLQRNAALRVQSILNTDQLLNVLLYKCGFSFSKVCSYISLLSVHHESVEHFLCEFPEILGVDTLFLIRRLPLLLKQENESIHESEVILKDFNISKDQLISCPKVLAITPSTLHKRLTALCNTEEFAALKSNKKFLWLVYYHKNLTSRLKRLKAENLPPSISMFTASKSTFEKYLVYSNTRRGIREAYVYLAEVLKMSEKEIYTRLKHCSHIRIEDENCSVQNCRKVIEFLLISGVTKSQILNGLEIVLYDAESVRTHFQSMKNHPLCQPYEEWISHYNLIQLLIYIIETSKYHVYHSEIDDHDELHFEISSN